MIDSVQDIIQSFLQKQKPESLHDMQEEGIYTKAGVIPFVRRAQGLRYYFMKPQSKIPELGEPPFQMCKGTRMIQLENGQWRDIKENALPPGVLESLVVTALREGIEELGLKLDNVVSLFDVGPYGFSSATTGKSKSMWLFAAEVKDADNFLGKGQFANSTAARKWMDEREFAVVGRDDHRYILTDIDQKLSDFLA